MSRLILILILVLIIYWVVRRALLPPRKEEGRNLSATREELVQDPQCLCYVPKGQSYILSHRGRKLFFCSEECCRKYLASRGLPGG